MLRKVATCFLLLCASTMAGCSGGSGFQDEIASSGAATSATSHAGPAISSFFLTPSAAGEQPVIDAIDGAATSIRMMMFHLTNPAVVDALVAAAGRGVDIEIILDNGNLSAHTPKSITAPLAKAGIKVIPSSTGFRITHVKSLVIDEKTAVIMSLNLTMEFATTRDFAVVTTNKGVVDEFLKVFAADVSNASSNTATTPTLTSPYLAWSPVNSESRLAAFVNAAKTSLVATSENLGDPEIQSAMIAAAQRGVVVRVISPLCDQNVNPLYDLPSLAALSAGGVDARAMPSPASAATPYMHAKMMIADGDKAFIGSVNFSTASTTDARELGIFFTDASAVAMISNAFETDWSHAIVPPPAASVSCTAAPSADGGVPIPDAAPPADAGPSVDAAPPEDASPAVDSGPMCPGFASPTETGTCDGCGSKACQENGCYGGYWCNTSSHACVSAAKVDCASQ